MRSIYIILIAVAVFVLQKETKAQQNPVNDPTSWIQKANGSGSEDFTSALDVNKWSLHNNTTGWGGEYLRSANLDVSSGTLKIKADTLNGVNDPGHQTVYGMKWADPDSDPVTYVYEGGAIESKTQNGAHVYNFGYVEIEAKYPTGKYPLWPAFWVWSANCAIPFINEIDIAENSAPNSYAGTEMGTNVHIYNPAANCTTYSTTDALLNIYGLPTLSSNWHKYAIEWSRDRIIWYFDDVPVRTIYDASGATVPQYPMAVVLNFAIDPWSAMLPSNWDDPFIFTGSPQHQYIPPVSWPQTFEINYLKYYKLATDCSTNLTNLCTPAGYDRAVKSSIATDAACTPTFNQTTPATSYTLRAVNHVTLNEGVEINPSGTGYFAIELMACPE